MARYRKIDVRIRADAKFRRLSKPQPNGQTLWIHLLTGQHTGSIPGLSSAGEAAMAEELGWSLEGFREAFREVFREGMAKADWEARVVWVPNVIKYDKPQSPNVVRSWRTAWDETPECALKAEAWHALKAFLEGLGEAFAKAFAEACPKPLANPEPEPEPDHSPSESVAREGANDAPLVGEIIPPDADPDRLTPERLVAMWNEATGGKIAKVDPDRRTAIRKAIARQPTPDFWRGCFAKAAAVKATDDAGWLTFDWIFGKSSKGLGWNAERMQAGSFDWKLRQAGPATPTTKPESDFERRMREKYGSVS